MANFKVVSEIPPNELDAILAPYRQDTTLTDAVKQLHAKILAIHCCGSPCVPSGPDKVEKPEDLFMTMHTDKGDIPVPALYAKCSECGAVYAPESGIRLS